ETAVGSAVRDRGERLLESLRQIQQTATPALTHGADAVGTSQLSEQLQAGTNKISAEVENLGRGLLAREEIWKSKGVDILASVQ
ncbi:unnamed protein product, partial [Amoebophrya sp. A25]